LQYIPDIDLYKLETLQDIVKVFDNPDYLDQLRIDHQQLPTRKMSDFDIDFADIK